MDVDIHMDKDRGKRQTRGRTEARSRIKPCPFLPVAVWKFDSLRIFIPARCAASVEV